MHSKLPTLKYRRRQDMIQVFHATQKYQPILGIIQNLTPEVINTNYLTTCFTTIYANILCARIANIWNSLPNSSVDVDTVCLFKARLDKFRMHQDVKYDFTADLARIGNKSVHKMSVCSFLCIIDTR